MVNVNFGNKTYYLLLGIFAVLIVSGVAYAYQSGEGPSVFGHSWYEQEQIFDLSDSIGCSSSLTEIDCQNVQGACVWTGAKCLPESASDLIVSHKGSELVTKTYVDSAVAGVEGGGISSGIKARCPRYSQNSLSIYGRTTAQSSLDKYGSFLNRNGLLVDYGGSPGSGHFAYMGCSESLDGTITFEEPYGELSSSDIEMQPGILNDDGFFLASSSSSSNPAKYIGGPYHLLMTYDINIDGGVETNAGSKFCSEFSLDYVSYSGRSDEPTIDTLAVAPISDNPTNYWNLRSVGNGISVANSITCKHPSA
jgi:hypothetical protein